MTDPGTRTTYETVADRYRKRNEDRSAVEELVSRFLAAIEDTTDGPARLLDAGCGPGWETARFGEAGHEPVGIDLTLAFLELAREETRKASFARMDMRRLGFPAATFDGIWACASFLHVPKADARATLAEFRRVLRPEGPVHLSVKHGEGTCEGSAYADDDRTFVLYRPAELEELLLAVGFAVETVGTDDADEWVRAEARA
ncbi:class I SAM-dependent methyltransferase [Saliphagus sp. LR7]|uniref:class I SAM-dependent methyltransferase n=1 Tax=Saliphagus sp. LR7 TaxID=2282654 RepID=UPI000DF7A771|nr:class I SAM-dependent methyltransferase [Saliphagus sp. LR7]